MIIYYAGIGSRDTPFRTLREMTRIAKYLHNRNIFLRSGGARGADLAFERGAGSRKVIYRASDCTGEALAHAAKYHPKWEACDNGARQLHGRNSLIVLGYALDNPVRFIVCWTEGGGIKGGTGQALRIAADPKYNIPVFNLYRRDAKDDLYDYLEQQLGVK